MTPGVGAEIPAGLLEHCDNRLDGFDLRLAPGFRFGCHSIRIRHRPITENAFVAGEAEAALDSAQRKVGMLFDKFIKDRYGVKVLGIDRLSVRVESVAPDFSVR